MQKPHGRKLIDRTVSGKKKSKYLDEANELPQFKLSRDQVKDIENIAYGVFSPLDGFMSSKNFNSVLHHMRLSDDTPWTIPVVLDVDKKDFREGDSIALLNESGDISAIMHVDEIYSYSKKDYSESVYKTVDKKHPGVNKVFSMKDKLIGGEIELIQESPNPFHMYTLKPMESRILFKEKGWHTIAGFQTRNVPHLGHEYVQKTALAFVDGIFINPLIGRKKQGDFTDEVILKTYESLVKDYYLKERAVLAILNTTMRYAGPREAIFHAIMRKNFGCTHFIVGRDHAGVGIYYKPYDAQDLFDKFPDLGVIPLFFKSFFHCRKCGGVVNEKTCPHPDSEHIKFSGTDIRERLLAGKKPQAEIMRKEIADIILKEDEPFVE